jgi:hypothetical protein
VAGLVVSSGLWSLVISTTMVLVSEPLSDEELTQIERRLDQAVTVAPPPWWAWLETQGGLGGESFVQFRGDPNVDNEMYLSVHLGADRLRSPDPRLDLIIDFVGNSAEDVRRLIGEIRRLQTLTAPSGDRDSSS